MEACEETAIIVLEYLNISHPRNMVFGERRLQKQADALNEVWYLKMKRAEERV